jgi:hypothetical protein
MSRTTTAFFLLGFVLLAPGPRGGLLDADDPVLERAAPPTPLSLEGPSSRASARMPRGRMSARVVARGDHRVVEVVAENRARVRRTCTADVSLDVAQGQPMARVVVPVRVFSAKIVFDLEPGETRREERDLPDSVKVTSAATLLYGASLSLRANGPLP